MAVNINTLITGSMTLGSTPAGHAETRITFSDETTETYNWSGEIDENTMIEADIRYEGGIVWKKDPVAVEIGNTVTSIKTSALSYCSSLTSITIPDVTNIGRDAFYGCSNLTSVTFLGKTLEQVQAMDNYPWGIENESIITVG